MKPYTVSVDLLVYATNGVSAEMEARMLLLGLREDGQLKGYAVTDVEDADAATAANMEGRNAPA